MSTNLSPNSSRILRRATTTRRRAGSHLPPVQDQESHDNALNVLRNYLKGRTCYDVFPVSFRLIVLDTKLEVKKALQCFLLNGMSHQSLLIHFADQSLVHRLPCVSSRCRIRTPVEQRKVLLRWHAHRFRHNPPHPILLPHFQLRLSRHGCRNPAIRIFARQAFPPKIGPHV